MKRIVPFMLIICLLAQDNVQAAIRYVRQTATGTGSGRSWTNASNDLQLMIDQSNSGDEIRVAGGNYKPTRPDTNTAVIIPNSRRNAFVLKSGISVYGGYFGNGGFANLRAPDMYVTTLDGDLGTANLIADNAYHVVIMPGISDAILDGFTITNGNANGSANGMPVNGIQVGDNGGAGIVANRSTSLSIANCRIAANNGTGLIVAFSGCTGSVAHTDIESNVCQSDGPLLIGYAYLSASVMVQSNMKFSHCRIRGNTSQFGTVTVAGGSTTRFYNCAFTGNNVTLNYGPAIRNGVLSTHGSDKYGVPATSIVNCTFSGNKFDTTRMAVVFADTAALYFENNIVWGNAEQTFPVFTTNGVFDIAHSVLQGEAWFINGVAPWSVNIDADPQFVNAPSYTTAPFTTGDYHIARCSPVINAGSNTYLAAADTMDMDGHQRIAAAVVDMGAYEYAMGSPDINGVVYVDSSAATGGDGSSWTVAITEVADALKAARYDTSIHQVWVKNGTYKPLYTADSLYCNTSDSRKRSFVIPDGVGLYGGFTGTETSLSQLDWHTTNTILSGDIGIPNNNTDNAYHVVIAAGTNSPNTHLYNFIVEKGQAGPAAPTMTVNGVAISGVMGAGMANQANAQGNTTKKGCDISYCIFRNNKGYYGALSNAFCNDVTIMGTKVINDSAASGGGIANLGPGTFTISHCTIASNKALYEGGGIFNRKCNVTIDNSIVSGNYSYSDGGGIKSDSSHTVISNCTIAGNKATYNFGGFNHFHTGAQTAVIANSILWGNDGAAYDNIDTANNPLISVTNCIVGDEPYRYGSNVWNVSPQFINPTLAMNAPSAAGDYHLSMCSPAINAGYYAVFTPYFTDIDYQNRMSQGRIDLGAYENAGYTLAQTPGDSIGATNFVNGCNFADFTPAYSVWQTLSDASGKLILSVNQPGNPLYNVLPLSFITKLRTQYGSGSTLQLSNPFGQTGYYYTMNRSWTFTASGNISSPVRLRFYFDAADSTDIAKQGNFGNLQNLIVYKVSGTNPYNPLATGYKEYTYAAVPDTGHFTIGTYQGVRYAELVVTSFSSAAIALKTNNPLAIKLENIRAANAGAQNRIDWNTLSEDGNDEFILERSGDAKDFTPLATIAARGKASSYTYWDTTPLNGMNYYRLNMSGSNQQRNYSKVVTAFVNNKIALEVYPNPSDRLFFINAPGSVNIQGYRILNMVGEVVAKGAVYNGSIDAGMTPSGNYILELQTSEGLYHKQVTIR